MRGKGRADIANILPSVRARGVLVPLIVRATETPDSYEILAGKRRYQAALAVAEESGEHDPLGRNKPCKSCICRLGSRASLMSPVH